MSLSKGLRFRVFTRDGFSCRYCGRSAPDVVLHADHVHPRSKGGRDTMSNLVTACRDCNAGKYDRILPTGAAPNGTTTDGTVGPPPVKTFPHPDRCGHCRDQRGHRRTSRLHVALREEPAGKDGYVAYYRCDDGHEWRTYWQADIRLTERELYETQIEDAAELSGRA